MKESSAELPGDTSSCGARSHPSNSMHWAKLSACRCCLQKTYFFCLQRDAVRKVADGGICDVQQPGDLTQVPLRNLLRMRRFDFRMQLLQQNFQDSADRIPAQP
jgi:hypothetical protein